MVSHIQSLGIAITVFQAFSRIFRYIQGYWSIFSHTHRRPLRMRGRPPLPFLKIKKSVFFFFIFWRNVYQSDLVPQTPPPPTPLLPWKSSGYALALIHYSICKTLHLKCLTVFWTQLCLDSSSVICTVTLCYVLHKTHSEFSHIQLSVFQVYAGLVNHIQCY